VVYADRFVRGPFHLGRFSYPIAITAVIWIAFISIVFCLPELNPVNSKTLNYAPVAVGIVLFYALGFWAVSARKWFADPCVSASSRFASVFPGSRFRLDDELASADPSSPLSLSLFIPLRVLGSLERGFGYCVFYSEPSLFSNSHVDLTSTLHSPRCSLNQWLLCSMRCALRRTRRPFGHTTSVLVDQAIMTQRGMCVTSYNMDLLQTNLSGDSWREPQFNYSRYCMYIKRALPEMEEQTLSLVDFAITIYLGWFYCMKPLRRSWSLFRIPFISSQVLHFFEPSNNGSSLLKRRQTPLYTHAITCNVLQ